LQEKKKNYKSCNFLFLLNFQKIYMVLNKIGITFM
jgi:hypothetical protein